MHDSFWNIFLRTVMHNWTVRADLAIKQLFPILKSLVQIIKNPKGKYFEIVLSHKSYNGTNLYYELVSDKMANMIHKQRRH